MSGICRLLAHPDGDDGGHRLGGDGGGGREPKVAYPEAEAATAVAGEESSEEEVKQKESASLQAHSLKCDE